ncbi:major facilitator superfamily domain-containing protein 6-like isoform X1 [Centruroides vittatus]|uniref:major facilitator superfamily domain-containing protein 6-like isoform X1 n=2 Tax=Centruroides vittatus TaxID=120091 RepID=UPI003510A9E9
MLLFCIHYILIFIEKKNSFGLFPRACCSFLANFTPKQLFQTVIYNIVVIMVDLPAEITLSEAGEGNVEILKLSDDKKLDGNMNETPPIKRKFHYINLKLLPLKMHFLFLFAGIACIVPYLPLYGKQLGISATGIGIIYSVIPCFSLATKPLFGWLADRFKKEKVLFAILIFTVIIFYISLIFIPPLRRNNTITLEQGCDIYTPTLDYPNMTCSSDFNKTLTCSKKCVDCAINDVGNITCEESSNENTLNVTLITLNHRSTFNLSEVSIDCVSNHTSHCEIVCDCDERCCQGDKEYETNQFWLFFLANVFAGVGRRTLHSLTDALCYDMLDGKTGNYGKQRLWGSVGRSVSPVLTGYLLDVTTSNNEKNYSVAIYVMATFLVIDIIAIMRLDLKSNKKQTSKTICKDVCSSYSELRNVVFGVAVCMNGILSGLYFVYFFWFLSEIGATGLLIGLSVLIRLVTEVPCFFYAGKIINKIGHFNSVIIAFVAFSVRFFAYVYIYNPWIVLPVEFTHGLTFGIFYASMTSFAKKSAIPGTEATVQGVLGALFDGLGMAIGNILGGLGFDYYGARTTFLAASITSAISAITMFIFHRYSMYKNTITRKNTKLQNGDVSLQPEEENML